MSISLPMFWRSFRVLMALSLAAPALASAQVAGATSEHLNTDDDGIALQGFDPVSYFAEGGPKMGHAEVSAAFGGGTYLFVSEENRALFEKTPERYVPAFGGWCAWAMLDGDKVEIDPMRFRLFEDRLLVFYDGLWGDTLKRWEKKLAKGSEQELYDQAAKQWSKIVVDAYR